MKRILSISCLIFSFTIGLAQEAPLRLSLQEAINYAIEHNFDNKTSANDIALAKQKKWETIAIGLPQLNGEVKYQNWLKQQVSLLPGEIAGGQPGTFVPVTFGTQQTMSASATLTQLLFDGSYLVGLQSVKTFLKISELAKQKTELATREAVINAYGNVLIAQKGIELFTKNKQVVQKNLNEIQKIYDNGLTELENVEQLQITLTSLDNNLRNATRMQGIAYQMLNVVLGNPIGKKLALTDTLSSLVLSNTDLQMLSKTFNIDNHIDFKLATNDRDAKALQVKLEKSKNLPTLAAFLNYGVTANSNEFTFLDSDQRWFDASLFGVNLNIPIFSSFSRRARTRQAQLNLENADIKLEKLKQQLSLQVASAKSDYQLSIENMQAAKKSLSLAERIEKKQQIKFVEGISSSLDLSQAQNQLYSQQNTYIQSMLDVITKKAKLETALNTPIK